VKMDEISFGIGFALGINIGVIEMCILWFIFEKYKREKKPKEA